MPRPLVSIESDEKLPEAADIVVIGAGVIGASTAYHVARMGYSVALLDKGVVGGEQSSRNVGFCRQQGREIEELPLMRQALNLWDDMRAVSGVDNGFRRTGLLYLSRDPAQVQRWDEWAKEARACDVPTVVLTGQALADKLPGNTEGFIGGMYTKNDGRAEPSMAAPAFAQGARQLGATIHQNCAARGLETAAGRVSAVVAERGRIRTDGVVLAGGTWSSLFCRRHGVKLPQGIVTTTVMQTTPGANVFDGGVATPNYFARRRLDGGYTLCLRSQGHVDITPDLFRYSRSFLPRYLQRLGSLRLRFGRPFFDELLRSEKWAFDGKSPFETRRVLDPAPDMKLAANALAAFTSSNRDLQGLRVQEAWGASLDTTPDMIPVISPVETLPGLTLATGFSGHGFGSSPAAGKLAAELAVGAPTFTDAAYYSHKRLIDGRKLRAPSNL